MVSNRRFIFCAGPSGSGTTLLLRLLSTPGRCASLGGIAIKVPQGTAARTLADAFRTANDAAWDRLAPFADHAAATQAWQASYASILAAPDFATVDRFVFKRSAPFGQPYGQRSPDLLEVDTLFPGALHVLILRDPCAATYSTFRRLRQFPLRHLAVMCSEQLTLLSAQASTIDAARLRVISYERMCADVQGVLGPVLDFCGIPAPPVWAKAAKEGLQPAANGRYRAELPADELAWLDAYFCDRRRRQWAFLNNAAGQ